MVDIQKLFKGKKVTIMGLGLLGRGIGDAAFFAEAGADLIVTDLKSAEELKPSIEKLKQFPDITYHLGDHQLEDFENRDLIIRAPNAPLDSPFLARAHEHNIPVEMDASLFAKLSPATIVGITGTRGKSTVTHLIYEMAKAAGKNPRIGGNERDTATLPLLKETDEEDTVILELDSWQLQGFAADGVSPHIAVWTNFMPDHMNYYKGDMERYFEDKAAIARFQKPGDFFITTSDIKKTLESRFGPLQGTCITDPVIPEEWDIALEGEHNRRNAGYARAAAQCLGITDDVIKEVLKNFHGLDGRLQLLGEKNGIAFYDDGNATTPEATLAALTTLAAKHRPIVLIAGGSDKNLSFAHLTNAIPEMTKKAIFFKGAATDKMLGLLPKTFSYEIVSTMSEAFTKALLSASAGDIILLSPAATSFGLFKNEYDRGDQFKALVEKLK